MVATSTIDPRLPEHRIAFISTPPAPSLGSSCGGGCSTIWPVGTSGVQPGAAERRRHVLSLPLAAGVDACRSGKGVRVAANTQVHSLHPPRPPGADRARAGRGRRPGRACRSLRRRRRRGVRPAVGPAATPDLHTPTGAQPRPTGRWSAPVSSPATCWWRPTTARRPATVVRRPHPLPRRAPLAGGRALGLWFAVVAGIAALAGWCAATPRARSTTHRSVSWSPVPWSGSCCRWAGRWRGARRRTGVPAPQPLSGCWDPTRAPADAGGVAGLTAALVAAVGRALDEHAEEALRVWVVVARTLPAHRAVHARRRAAAGGVGLVLVAAVLAARFVPGLVVDVPDQYLIDLRRLAVTAWSARTQPPGKRGRAVVPIGAVATVAGREPAWSPPRERRCCSLTLVAAPMVLATATLAIDRIGRAAWCSSPAPRSCSPPAATATRRPAGSFAPPAWPAGWCWRSPCCGSPARGRAALDDAGRLVLGGVLVVAAVAVGRAGARRGGRAAPRWPRGLCGALALASGGGHRLVPRALGDREPVGAGAPEPGSRPEPGSCSGPSLGWRFIRQDPGNRRCPARRTPCRIAIATDLVHTRQPRTAILSRRGPRRGKGAATCRRAHREMGQGERTLTRARDSWRTRRPTSTR